MGQLRSFSPAGLDNRFREGRFRIFNEIVQQVLRQKDSCRILDIGGEEEYWARYGSALDWQKVEVCSVNLSARPSSLPGLKTTIGDARSLTQFRDMSFDIVHSNSVIEHVGRWDDMAAMAGEVRRLAPRYFVQTPYFWFPLEPHARYPFLHWMPESWRYRILMRRTCGFWRRQPDLGNAVKAVQSATLLDRRQFQYLFPDAKIMFEKVLVAPKSLIAVR